MILPYDASDQQCRYRWRALARFFDLRPGVERVAQSLGWLAADSADAKASTVRTRRTVA